MSYEKIALTVVLVVLLGGLVAELLVRKLRLRSYGRIAADVAAIAKAIHGEIGRDGGDLLIRGSMSSTPVLVRFSHSDHCPGLHIQMPAGRNVSLFCVPKGHESQGGLVPLAPPDARFKARFRLSSNHPTEAKLLFYTPALLAEIQKLCHSSRGFLVLEGERLELSELLIPAENLTQHVLDCIRGMLMIAEASWQMPGMDPENAPRVPRRWNWFRTAYVGGSVLLLSVMLIIPRLRAPANAPQPSPMPSGIADTDARQIPEVRDWQLAQSDDFDADAVAWLQQQGRKPKGSIRGAFDGSGDQDSVYVLKRASAAPGDPRRLVVVINGQVRFDANLPEIALAARIPKDSMASIEWRGRAPVGQPDGDGILVIRSYQDPSSAMVLFASGVQLLTGRPKDFHTISFQ